MLAVKPADGLTAFVVGGIGYGTGVDNADICLLTVADFGKSLFLQLLPDSRSLRKVQFAAQGVIYYLFIVEYCVVYHCLS
jgi:hypothetical protein